MYKQTIETISISEREIAEFVGVSYYNFDQNVEKMSAKISGIRLKNGETVTEKQLKDRLYAALIDNGEVEGHFVKSMLIIHVRCFWGPENDEGGRGFTKEVTAKIERIVRAKGNIYHRLQYEQNGLPQQTEINEKNGAAATLKAREILKNKRTSEGLLTEVKIDEIFGEPKRIHNLDALFQ